MDFLHMPELINALIFGIFGGIGMVMKYLAKKVNEIVPESEIRRMIKDTSALSEAEIRYINERLGRMEVLLYKLLEEKRDRGSSDPH